MTHSPTNSPTALNIEHRRIETLVHRHQWVDDCYPFRYSFDVSSGCAHRCLFCRANWVGPEERKVILKQNLLDVLGEELAKIPPGGMVGVGGGYNEPFSKRVPREHTSRCFSALQQLVERGHKPFVATRSVLALQLRRLFEGFSRQHLPIVGMGISSIDDAGARNIEPDLDKVSERLSVLEELRKSGFEAGICAMPIIPFYNDSDGELLSLVQEAKRVKASFVLFQALDVVGLRRLWKGGFFTEKQAHDGVEQLLKDEAFRRRRDWERERFFVSACRESNLPIRLERRLFEGRLSEKDEATVLLLLMYHHKLHMGRRRDAYRFAAYTLNKTSETSFVRVVKERRLESLPGFGGSGHIANFVYGVVGGKATEYEALLRVFYDGKSPINRA